MSVLLERAKVVADRALSKVDAVSGNPQDAAQADIT
jgi:hypothetical protein